MATSTKKDGVKSMIEYIQQTARGDSRNPKSTIKLVDGKPVGSAIFHANTQAFRVRIGNKSWWEDSEFAAQKSLELECPTIEEIERLIGAAK